MGLVLLLHDVYRLIYTYQEGAREVDEQKRGVLPTLPHIRHPVRPETERRTAIRQTVPTTAAVEAEMSTLIKIKGVIIEFHIEFVNLLVYKWKAEMRRKAESIYRTCNNN